MNSITRPLVRLVIAAALVGIALLPATQSGSPKAAAQAQEPYHRLVQTIETAELGVGNPAGLAYVPAAGALLLSPGPSSGPSADLVRVTPTGILLGTDRLTLAVNDPLDLVFDAAGNRLLFLIPQAQELVSVPAGPDGSLNGAGAINTRYSMRDLQLQGAQGLAVNPHDGTFFVLDAAGQRLISITPDANRNLDPALARQQGRLKEANLAPLGLGQIRGVAFNPGNGHLYILSRAGMRLHELTQDGQLVSSRDLSATNVRDPQSMVFAPSADSTDDPNVHDLYIADRGGGAGGGQLLEVTFTAAEVTALPNKTATTLVQTIRTSSWNPPSPDPAGLTYLADTNRLLVVDSEVEEMTIFKGVNVYRSSLTGSLNATYSTLEFSKEPTDIAINPSNGNLFFSDDGRKAIFEVDTGGDNTLGTADDTITLFPTTDFGCGDPEGVAYGNNKLFIACGVDQEIFTLSPGANGRFNGTPPSGDDTATHFDTSVLGQPDPEGVFYNQATNTLFIISNDKQTTILETTLSGSPVAVYDMSHVGAHSPAGIVVAPGSQTAVPSSMYVAERGIDNNNDPNENDGRIYELRAGGVILPPSQLLANPDFELDNNGDNKPDSWSTSSKFTRSNTQVQNGSYAGRFLITDNTGVTIKQVVGGLSAGTAYSFSGWVNIPTISDSFTFEIRVRWRNSSNSTLRTDTVKKYTDDTGGAWDQATATLTAPTGTDNAMVQLLVKSLNGTIYVDNFSFGP